MTDDVRSDWVRVFAGVEINMRTGQTVDFGEIVAGKPERMVLGQLSKEALYRARELNGWRMSDD